MTPKKHKILLMITSFIRTALVWVVGVPLTIVAALLMAFGTVIDRSRNLNNIIGRGWARIIFFIGGVKFKVEGGENIPQDRSILIGPNHQGALDVPALHLALNKQFRWIAKKELFKIPFFGWCMFFMGCVPIDRSNSKRAMASLLHAAEDVKNSTSILIFPEGTRNPYGDGLLPFKRGLFTVAVKSEAPILPVAVLGARALMPKGSSIIRPGTINIKIGKPIESIGKEVDQLKNELREALEHLLK